MFEVRKSLAKLYQPMLSAAEFSQSTGSACRISFSVQVLVQIVNLKYQEYSFCSMRH